MFSRISIDMWRVFVAVATEGSTIKAASRLHKTQSAISHALKKIEGELAQQLFEVQGRNLVLTPLGKVLLPKAQRLLGEADTVENFGRNFKLGQVNEIIIAVDILVDQQILLKALASFSQTYPDISVRIHETVLSGAQHKLENGAVAIGIASRLPTGLAISPFDTVTKHCVCAPSHPLANAQQLSLEALTDYVQIVMQDSGPDNIDSGWLGSTKRYSVSHLSTAIEFVLSGAGYAWLPTFKTDRFIQVGDLHYVDLKQGAERQVHLQMGMAEKFSTLPEVHFLYECLASYATVTTEEPI